MFSEDYKRGVCLDDLDVGLDWNALIIPMRDCEFIVDCKTNNIYLVIYVN